MAELRGRGITVEQVDAQPQGRPVNGLFLDVAVIDIIGTELGKKFGTILAPAHVNRSFGGKDPPLLSDQRGTLAERCRIELCGLFRWPLRLQFGPELSVKYVDADLTMTGVDALSGIFITESESAKVPIPTLGARARIGFSDYIALVGRVGYSEYQDNSFLDAEAQIEFSPIPLVGVFGGYRYLDLKVDDSGVFVDAQFSGPFVGALIRF